MTRCQLKHFGYFSSGRLLPCCPLKSKWWLFSGRACTSTSCILLRDADDGRDAGVSLAAWRAVWQDSELPEIWYTDLFMTSYVLTWQWRTVCLCVWHDPVVWWSPFSLVRNFPQLIQLNTLLVSLFRSFFFYQPPCFAVFLTTEKLMCFLEIKHVTCTAVFPCAAFMFCHYFYLAEKDRPG